jgi:hypothetical protein
MKSQTAAVIFVVLLFVSVPLALAQQSSLQPSQPSADTSATPAIAYSEMQAPVPAPAAQPSLDPVPPSQQQQPEDRQRQQSAPETSQPRQDAARSFSGTILKDGERFVLKTTDNVNFQLDDQERAKKYEGTEVKVTGSVDSATHTIHIQNIEPIA